MSAKDVKSLLRLVNFYKKFINDFLALAKPFTNYLKKEGLVEWKVNNKRRSTF
jgi:hypothetical protein